MSNQSSIRTQDKLPSALVQIAAKVNKLILSEKTYISVKCIITESQKILHKE